MESHGLLFECLLPSILADLHSIRSLNHPSMQQPSCLTHELVEGQVLRQFASREYQAAVMNALGCGLLHGVLRFRQLINLHLTSPVGVDLNVCLKIAVAVPRIAPRGCGLARPCMDMYRFHIPHSIPPTMKNGLGSKASP